MKTPPLETRRLILRPITPDDAAAIQKYFNNWNVIQHLSTNVPWPYPDDGAKDFIENSALPRMRNKSAMIWVLAIKDHGDEAVGVIEFRLEEQEDGHRGFWLAERFWRRGAI